MFLSTYIVEIYGVNAEFEIDNKYRIASFIDRTSATSCIKEEISKLSGYKEILSDDVQKMIEYADNIQVSSASRRKFKKTRNSQGKFYCSDYVFFDLYEMPILGKIEFSDNY